MRLIGQQAETLHRAHGPLYTRSAVFPVCVSGTCVLQVCLPVWCVCGADTDIGCLCYSLPHSLRPSFTKIGTSGFSWTDLLEYPGSTCLCPLCIMIRDGP